MAKHTTNSSKRLAIGLMAVLGLSTGWAASSEAAPVTYNFAGKIIETHYEPGNPYQGDIHVDTPFEGSVTFDSVGKPPQSGSTGHEWYGLPYQMHAILGGHGFSGSDRVHASIYNDFLAMDVVIISACDGDPCQAPSLELDLRDTDHTVFTDTGVPLNIPPVFGEFETKYFGVVGPLRDWWLRGELTSMTCANGEVGGACGFDPVPATVPEPGTLLLLTPGLAFVACVRRRVRARGAHRSIAGLIVLIGLSFGSVASSEASPMTFNFEGHITTTNFRPGNPYIDDIKVNTPFSGSYTIDTEDAHPNSHLWNGLPYQMNVTVGGHSFSNSQWVRMNVFDNVLDNVDGDNIVAFACEDQNCLGRLIELWLRDDDGTVLGDTGVQTGLPSLFSGFELKYFFLRGPLLTTDWWVDGA